MQSVKSDIVVSFLARFIAAPVANARETSEEREWNDLGFESCKSYRQIVPQ